MIRAFVKWSVVIALALFGVWVERSLPDLLPDRLDRYLMLVIVIIAVQFFLLPKFDRLWPKRKEGWAE
ncbi:hypothetical protein [Sphingopyxis sp. JAI128]|uniref:hypothetical protein n=1 Tax=Sphingopyxis sp. JAI128 TaxID=2723066 RepID=UPI00161280B6|nr:hypothetical protein [Sphingopyxis sp. JAI128]MBB6424468.1 hypothetical protein [Sphingopyxis sp. JAI128]